MAYFLQWPEYNRIALSLDRKPVAYGKQGVCVRPHSRAP